MEKKNLPKTLERLKLQMYKRTKRQDDQQPFMM